MSPGAHAEVNKERHTHTHEPPRGVNGAPYQAAEDGASRTNVDLPRANNNKRLADLNTGMGVCTFVWMGEGGGTGAAENGPN